MRRHTGFTLIEIVVVLIIVGILVGLATPSYLNSMHQAAATSTEHNLIAIYNAQKNYYFTNGSYCTQTTGNPATGYSPCGKNLTNLNYNLATLDQANPTLTSLGITDSYFTSYVCNAVSNGASCTATSSSIPVTLTVNTTMPLVSAGGTNCPTGTETNYCNPICTGTTNLCPTS